MSQEHCRSITLFRVELRFLKTQDMQENNEFCKRKRVGKWEDSSTHGYCFHPNFKNMQQSQHGCLTKIDRRIEDSMCKSTEMRRMNCFEDYSWDIQQAWTIYIHKFSCEIPFQKEWISVQIIHWHEMSHISWWQLIFSQCHCSLKGND